MVGSHAHIQNSLFFPYFFTIFICPEFKCSQVKHTNSTTKYQLQLNTDEKNLWQKFADDNFRGNLARMIRTLVNHSILKGYDDNSRIPEELESVISSIQANSEQTSNKVGSFESDLTIIKNLLSKLLQKSSEHVMSYQNSISVPLEDLVQERVYEYVKSQKWVIMVEELIDYLVSSCIECKRYITREDLKIPSGGKIALAFILEDVTRELIDKGEIDVSSIQGGNRYDF